MLGRLTLNPIKHIDPFGTILVPGVLLMLGGFVFGWAKPVPVSFRNLNNPKADMAWVAFAGPFANFIMALFWALIIKLGMMLLQSDIMIGEPMVYMGVAGVLINSMLMMLNLLPLPPLDGGRILVSWLPEPYSSRVAGIERYGFIILIGLIYFKILYLVLWPLIATLLELISTTYQIPMQVFQILG
jgi:Zn-dependent protease